MSQKNKLNLKLRKVAGAFLFVCVLILTTAFFLIPKSGSEEQEEETKRIAQNDTSVTVKNSVWDWVADKTRKKLSVPEYIKWLQNSENGLKQQKTIGYYRYTLQYKPSDYMALNETRDINMPQQLLEEKSKNYNDYYFFTFTIEDTIGKEEILKSNIKSNEDYGRRIEYFSFSMQKDLYMVEGMDTIPCIMYNYERVYGLAPQANFTLGFSKRKKNKYLDKVIVYEDQEFGAGIVKLRITADQLRDTPLLKMK